MVSNVDDVWWTYFFTRFGWISTTNPTIWQIGFSWGFRKEKTHPSDSLEQFLNLIVLDFYIPFCHESVGFYCKHYIYKMINDALIYLVYTRLFFSHINETSKVLISTHTPSRT